MSAKCENRIKEEILGKPGSLDSDTLVNEIEVDLTTEITNLLDEYYTLDMKDDSKNQLEPEFAQTLMNTVQSYAEVASAINMDKVNIKEFANEIVHTSGAANAKDGQILMRINPNSKLSSRLEILTHELGHVMSHDAFTDNVDLRNLTRELREATKKAGADYTLFLSRIDNPTEEQIKLAKAKFDRVFDKYGDEEEFYAYATSNQNVWNAVNKVTTVVDTKLIDGYEGNGILDKLIKVVNKVWQAMTGRGRNGAKTLAHIVAIVAQTKLEVDNQKRLDTIDQGVLSRLEEYASDIIEEKEEILSNFVDGKIGGLKKRISKLPLLSTAIENRAVQYLYRSVVKTTTGKDWKLYQVFRQSKSFVEKQTSDMKNSVKRVLVNNFSNLDEGEKSAIKSVVMRADISSVTTSTEELKKLLTDDTVLKKDLGEYSDQLVGMAELMIKGISHGTTQYTNAINLVSNTDIKMSVQEVDELVSKIAIAMLPDADKKAMMSAIEKAPTEIEDLLNLHKTAMTELRDSSNISPTFDNIPKGYTYETEGLMKYRLVPEYEVDASIKLNMQIIGDRQKYAGVIKPEHMSTKKRLASIDPYIIINGIKYYMMKGRVKDTGFDEGALGVIGTTTEGISLVGLIKEGLFKQDKIDKATLQTNNEFTDVLIDSLKDGLNNKKSGVRLLNTDNAIVPVYGQSGNIIDYRIRLSHENKLLELGVNNSLEDVVSDTFSRSTKSIFTKQNNIKVVKQLNEFTRANYAKNKDDFILIEEYTDEMKEKGVPYAERHQRWGYLPESTKQYIREVNKAPKLLIHKDFLEMITGEKDRTVGNFRLGKIDIKKYPKIKGSLVAVESYSKEVIKIMKRALVLLDAGIVAGNIISNVVVAAMHGVSPLQYVSEAKKNWKLLNEYNELTRKKADLQVKKKMGYNIDKKMKELNRQLNNHTMHLLAKDGQFSPIVEDINVDASEDGQLQQLLKEKLYDTKYGDTIKKVIDVLYVDKNTLLGKLATKNLHMQDVITRKIVLDKMIKDNKQKKGRKLNDDEMQKLLNYVDQLLVNYSYTMQKDVKYADNVLGEIFLRYYLLQAKAVHAMLVKNPLKVLAVKGSEVISGLDKAIADPMDTYARSITDSLNSRFMLDDTAKELIKPNILNVFGQ